jgi:hypothetical protein
MPPIPVDVKGGTLTFTVPEPSAREGRGQNIGDDVAFKITPAGHTRRSGSGAADFSFNGALEIRRRV